MSLNLNACAEDGEACKYSEALELHLQKLGSEMTTTSADSDL